MSRRTDLLRRAVLQHAPQRHGHMLPPGGQAKYHETRKPPTEDQLRHHLTGEITLAAPATRAALAACIVYDIDGDGLVTITALLDAATERGLWAWGEWHLATDRGYVWIPFDQLINAPILHQFGQDLVAAASLSDEQRRTLDNRTANNAITRLPFGRHTHTGQRGDLIFQDGTSGELERDPEAALALWADRYQENSASQVTSFVGLTPARPETVQHTDVRSAPEQHKKQLCYTNKFIKAEEIQRRWNIVHDIESILAAAGGRRAGRTSWHCPCGQHRHGDHTPSLLIRPAKRALYGEHIIQGYSPSCAFHNPKLVFDAFNVYRILHGLSNDEMLQLARRELGCDTPERPQTAHRDLEGGRIQPTRQPATQPATKTNQTMIAPPQDAPSAADVLARAGRDSSLSPAMRKVLTTILGLLGDRSTARIRLATLISQSGLARRTIQAALRRLEAAGYLVITPQANEIGGQIANQYTLYAGGGDHADHPFKLKHGRGGKPPHPNAEPMPAPVISAPAPAPAAPPFRVESAPTITAAPVTAPPAEITPPSMPGSSVLGVPQAEEAPEAASFDPVVYAAWVATLDDQAERPWGYGRSPRQVMQGHEYGLTELRRTQTEHGPLVTSSPPPPVPPAPRLRQTTLRLAVPAIAPAPVVGVQALRTELARLERDARRYFAQQVPTAGRQTQQRAAAIRRQLAELEIAATSQRVAGRPERPPSISLEKSKKRRKLAHQSAIAT